MNILIIFNKNFLNKNLENKDDDDNGSDSDDEVDEDESASSHDEMNAKEFLVMKRFSSYYIIIK